MSEDRPASRSAPARAPTRVFTGIGHNLPQQALQAFAQAVVDVDGF